MNAIQITTTINSDPITRKHFCGVYALDKLPNVIEKYPCGIIANTDRSDEPGTHWVALYFQSFENAQFFDSYGNHPDFYNNIFSNYLDTHSVNWTFNPKILQSVTSAVCGQYCIFFLSYKSRGYSMISIVNMFSNNKKFNDFEVLSFVKDNFVFAI